MTTKSEIIAELEALGVDFDPGERKGDLQDLLDSALAADERTARSFEDVSGLCRQCGRPADHKHIGV